MKWPYNHSLIVKEQNPITTTMTRVFFSAWINLVASVLALKQNIKCTLVTWDSCYWESWYPLPVLGAKSTLLFRNGIALGTSMFNFCASGLWGVKCLPSMFSSGIKTIFASALLTVANSVSSCLSYSSNIELISEGCELQVSCYLMQLVSVP